MKPFLWIIIVCNPSNQSHYIVVQYGSVDCFFLFWKILHIVAILNHPPQKTCICFQSHFLWSSLLIVVIMDFTWCIEKHPKRWFHYVLYFWVSTVILHIMKVWIIKWIGCQYPHLIITTLVQVKGSLHCLFWTRLHTPTYILQPTFH